MTLPPHIIAELDRIGVTAPQDEQKQQPHLGPVWMPKTKGEEPPF